MRVQNYFTYNVIIQLTYRFNHKTCGWLCIDLRTPESLQCRIQGCVDILGRILDTLLKV